MNRVIMDRNGSNPNVSSRIPRFAGSYKSFAVSDDNHQEALPNISSSVKPTRLEQMQMEYQRNILKQKEDKLITIYESNQQRALQKVNQNRGFVKEFLNERRAANGVHNPLNTPSIEQLYLQKKTHLQMPQSNLYMNNGGPSINKPLQKYSFINSKINTGMERSAGRDRSKPLVPISRNVHEQDNPFAQRKAQMVRPKTYKGTSAQMEYNNEEPVPRSAPSFDDFNKYYNEEEDSDDSSAPNVKQLQYLQKKRKQLQMQKSSIKTSDAALPGPSKQGQQYITKQFVRTSEQERSNEANRAASDDDEGYDEVNNSENNIAENELKRKQQELCQLIASQQKELDRLRQERKLAEAEELIEIERRKKNEDEERKKIVEEETIRQKEKEEEKRKKQLAEEKRQTTEEEENKLSSHSKNSYSSDTTVSSNVDQKIYTPTPQYYDQKPTPPSQPKPQNTRKPPQATHRLATRSVTPKGDDHTALYAHADKIEGAFEDTGTLVPCFNCGRKFAEERLTKHEKSCKNLTKKRKVLDPSKLRTRGTEMEKYQNHRQPTPTKTKKKNWRTQHQNFIDTIKYAKKVSQIEMEGGNVADLPPPPATENPDYVQCPHCSRKFNQTTAERHIPHCANTRARPSPPKRK